MHVFPVCNNNTDCDKEKEKCDPVDHICRKVCTLKKDCQGEKMSCDTNKGLCVNGRSRYKCFEYNLPFISLFSVILGCDNDNDCKSDERCDTNTNICKKQCEYKSDCKGDKQTCDTNTGFCVNGKIYVQHL